MLREVVLRKVHELSGSVKAILLMSELKVLFDLSQNYVAFLFQYIAYHLQNMCSSCFLLHAYCVGCMLHLNKNIGFLQYSQGINEFMNRVGV